MTMVNSNTSELNPTTGVTTSSSDSSMADFDTFLKLLTAQLANQDPLDPTDGTEFTAQLAQFSSLEQQINTNDLLKDMIDSQPDNNQAEAVSYIGNEILAPGSNFKLGNTGNAIFSYSVDSDIESANATIYDSNGKKIHEFKVNESEGLHEVVWDGRDSEGNRLDAGAYSVKVESANVKSDGSQSNTSLSTYIYSEATQATKVGNSYAILTADGRTVMLEDIQGSKKLEEKSSSSTDHANALQMLGKQVLIPGSEFAYSGDGSRKFTYGLTQDVQVVTVTITDKDGNKIKEVPALPTAGSHEFEWDGEDSSGKQVDEGEYLIEIKAQNTNADKEIDTQVLDTLFYGTATKVEATDGIVLIHTDDGRNAFYDQVIATKE